MIKPERFLLYSSLTVFEKLTLVFPQVISSQTNSYKNLPQSFLFKLSLLIKKKGSATPHFSGSLSLSFFFLKLFLPPQHSLQLKNIYLPLPKKSLLLLNHRHALSVLQPTCSPTHGLAKTSPPAPLFQPSSYEALCPSYHSCRSEMSLSQPPPWQGGSPCHTSMLHGSCPPLQTKCSPTPPGWP